MVFAWIGALWRTRQRQLDLDTLWPICVAETDDLEHAKRAFQIHASLDPAWWDLNEDEINLLIDRKRMTHDRR